MFSQQQCFWLSKALFALCCKHGYPQAIVTYSLDHRQCASDFLQRNLWHVLHFSTFFFVDWSWAHVASRTFAFSPISIISISCTWRSQVFLKADRVPLLDCWRNHVHCQLVKKQTATLRFSKIYLQVTWDSVGSDTSKKPVLENIGFVFLTLILCHLEADMYVYLKRPPYWISDFRLHGTLFAVEPLEWATPKRI